MLSNNGNMSSIKINCNFPIGRGSNYICTIVSFDLPLKRYLKPVNPMFGC